MVENTCISNAKIVKCTMYVGILLPEHILLEFLWFDPVGNRAELYIKFIRRLYTE